MSKIAPCKDCESRHAECHATCQLYKDWKGEHEKEKEKSYARQKLNMDYVDYVLEQRARRVRPKSALRTQKIVAQI